MKTKYNYVIFGSSQENFLYSFKDINKLDNAVYICDVQALLGWKYSFFTAHMSKKANRFFRLPLKSLWNHSLFNENPFNDDRPICFIFFRNWHNLVSYAGFGNYLKRKFKDSKTVLFLQDILAKSRDMYTNKKYDIEKIKKLYDCILSYDQTDCKNYGLIYHPTVFSVPDLPSPNNFPEMDVYFLGLAKNRFSLLANIYEELTRAGLKCDFFISGVPEDRKIKRDGIHYISHMSYTENLQRIEKTKCILELMQEGAQGYTFRLWESIVMNKKLLSNNKSLVDSPFNNENYIRIFNSCESNIAQISNWIQNNQNVKYNNDIIKRISPQNLLLFIDNILSKK